MWVSSLGQPDNFTFFRYLKSNMLCVKWKRMDRTNAPVLSKLPSRIFLYKNKQREILQSCFGMKTHERAAATCWARTWRVLFPGDSKGLRQSYRMAVGRGDPISDSCATIARQAQQHKMKSCSGPSVSKKKLWRRNSPERMFCLRSSDNCRDRSGVIELFP